jgi:hypothetical protein
VRLWIRRPLNKTQQIRPGGTAVLAAASDLAGAAAAIGSGAELIDLWQASAGTADAVAARYPGVPACARAPWAALTRDPAAALRTGAALICAGTGGTGGAERAVAAGVDRGLVLIEAPPGQAGGLLAAGWAVIVTADDQAGPHAAAAVAAIACWLGAAAVRTGHVTAARRAIDMTRAVSGAGPATGARPAPGGCALP